MSFNHLEELLEQSLVATGAVVDIVELDPLVISESVRSMGFPAFSDMTATRKRALPTPKLIDQVMWRGIHERLFLYESEAEEFILRNQSNTYGMIFYGCL